MAESFEIKVPIRTEHENIVKRELITQQISFEVQEFDAQHVLFLIPVEVHQAQAMSACYLKYVRN